jgi:hypothetical protein
MLGRMAGQDDDEVSSVATIMTSPNVVTVKRTDLTPYISALFRATSHRHRHNLAHTHGFQPL